MYLEVEGSLVRITFKDKAEFYLKKGKQGIPAHYTNHPLLLNHNEARTTLYINSRPDNPQELFEDIQKGIDSIYQDWRYWRTILFGYDRQIAVTIVQQNLIQGSGILLDRAPAPILKAVIVACEKHGVVTNFFGSLEATLSSRGVFSVLFLDTCYVIARDFTVSFI